MTCVQSLLFASVRKAVRRRHVLMPPTSHSRRRLSVPVSVFDQECATRRHLEEEFGFEAGDGLVNGQFGAGELG